MKYILLKIFRLIQGQEVYLEIKNAENTCHSNIHENNSCGDIVLALKEDNAEEICTAENMAKVLMGTR